MNARSEAFIAFSERFAVGAEQIREALLQRMVNCLLTVVP